MRYILPVYGLLLLLLRMLRAHLAVVNEGSPQPEAAHAIADPSLAQAFYGHLGDGEADYYRFDAAPGTMLQFSMLIPERRYAAGFCTTLTITGPGLPPDGLALPPGDEGMRQGTTLYRRTQRAALEAAGGAYLVTVRAAGAGVYCFCIGTREPDTYADETTRARVRSLLEEQA